jgi:hypothetical protein
VRRVKKALSSKALAKEAEFWKGIKKAVKENPEKLCRK